MKTFLKSIDNQIEFNRGKNIFLDNLDEFKFTNEIFLIVSTLDELDSNSKKFLIEYTTDKVIEEFCRVNQYYSFSSNTKNDLRIIYSQLFDKIQTKAYSLEEIPKQHYENLKDWIKKNNLFAETYYKTEDKQVVPVACAEYSPELQFNILHLDISNIIQPVLDIGCGKQGYLVNYFLKQKIECIGIDRLSFNNSNLINADWLEYNYGKDKWGTIISNLGFSNHFIHHNLRKDGNYIEYAKTYMNILNSLKTGGSFHYAPDLPFIEKYLDNSQYSIKKFDITNYDFKAVKIKKLI